MAPQVTISLDAVIVAVTADAPRILVVGGGDVPAAIPSGRLDTETDETLELAIRRLIAEQTGLGVGYVEQLYTFGDRSRRRDDTEGRAISVAYVALVRETAPREDARWVDAYELFPWEDHRNGRPPIVDDALLPALTAWAGEEEARRDRIEIVFGEAWDGIRVLDRYELLYEAGLVAEHAVDRGLTPAGGHGTPLRNDHRRIAATALGRIRGKLTYRPVVFELLPERFTLLELLRTVEALAGVRLHKQNFRRLVERSGLVEGTGDKAPSRGGGRPAELFRYRPEVQLERPRPGVGQPYR